MPASSWPISARNSARSSASSISASSASKRAATGTTSASPAYSRSAATRLGVALLRRVRDVDHRLHRQQVDARRHALGEQPRGLAAVEVREQPVQHVDLGRRHLVPGPRRLGEPLDAALDDRVVGEHQLEVDRLGVRHRVDAAVDVEHVGVGKRAHHVEDRVGRAQVAEELAAERPPLARAADEPRRRRRTGSSRGWSRATPRPRARSSRRASGTACDADVGRRLRGGVGGHLCARARERVEHRRLADVGQADDADLERRHRPSSVGRASARRRRSPTPRWPRRRCRASCTRPAAIRTDRTGRRPAAPAPSRTRRPGTRGAAALRRGR